MERYWLLCLTVCLVPGVFLQEEEFLYGVFPPDFMWGTATSSYQIEGAWNVDGKGENIWDNYTHRGGSFGETGDVACNSYYQYQEDVQLLKNLGVHFYRFSLSWARILPDGTLAGGLNQAGIDYYNNLIDELVTAGIDPLITLYHWDLPQNLQDMGGWQNSALIGYFADYSRVAFEYFGDRVKYWITFNEPKIVTYFGYGSGLMAPGLSNVSHGGYETAHIVLKAHAEAYHAYDDDFRPSQNGRIGITLNAEHLQAYTDDQLHIDAAERGMQMTLGAFAHAIYSADGDYPPIMRERVDAKSAAQGYPVSKLPYFTNGEVNRIKGSSDFFGLNHYTTQYVLHEESNINCTAYDCDRDLFTFKNNTAWPESGSIWLRSVPWGFRRLLKWIKGEYGDIDIFVTENGVSETNSSTLHDVDRQAYFTGYINNMLQAHLLDGVNVKAYTAWSLMDNFEWRSGFDERFGMHYIDFEGDPSLTRVAKDSVNLYSTIIQDNGFPAP